MITSEQIHDLFSHTRRLMHEGRVGYEIDGVCRWSFFLIDADREKLTRAGRHLEQRGYEIVGFLEPAPEDDGQAMMYLRFDRVERHTPDSLIARNDELDKLAADFGLEGYDGMDVGAAEGP
jgi:hypothetical protein